ncbi:hypothetical protein [Chryseolinea lacunae]|uniref:Uncharacterized protein n=1 Tax=Chryseolinea lacunae TaxID=2801331 RepID=A0ABS1KWW5_9BACT|nr:hypothetical protein [Chryseolinea lacunae]MBL0743904.1 hypothetical protein [Chryseolinea lacunae]
MYSYALRPEYGGQNLLLEFRDGVENDSFLPDLFRTFAELNFVHTSITDLWMNDEVLFAITSSVGDFTLSKDIWNLAFITAENNQAGILALDACLQRSGIFEKVDVDFDAYRLEP